MSLITLYLVNDTYIISLRAPGYELRPYSFHQALPKTLLLQLSFTIRPGKPKT